MHLLRLCYESGAVLGTGDSASKPRLYSVYAVSRKRGDKKCHGERQSWRANKDLVKGCGGESDAYLKNAILISFHVETLFTPESRGEHLDHS